MTAANPASSSRPFAGRPITGKMVLAGMLAFFGVIFAVNGVFLYFALDTWPGLGSDNPYERGIAHNQTIAAAERQQALGWQGGLTYDGGALVLRLNNRAGTGVEITSGSIHLSRPASVRFDRTLPLVRQSSGVFTAKAGVLGEGQWLAKVSVEGPRGESYRMDHRLTVKR